MATARIKEQYKTAVVSFGNSGLPLGVRDDIDQLAIIAMESGNKLLINFFEHLPPLEDLKNGRLESKLASINIDRKVQAHEEVITSEKNISDSKESVSNSGETKVASQTSAGNKRKKGNGKQ